MCYAIISCVWVIESVALYQVTQIDFSWTENAKVPDSLAI